MPNGAIDAFTRIEAESFSAMLGVETSATLVGSAGMVGFLDEGDSLRYDDVWFGAGATWFSAILAVAPEYAGQSLDLRVDSATGPLLGTLVVRSTGDWDTTSVQSVRITGVAGLHDLFLLPHGAGTANVDAFVFAQTAPESEPDPVPPPPAGPATAAVQLAPHALTTAATSGALVIEGLHDVVVTGRRLTNPSGPCVVVRAGAGRVTLSGNSIGPCAGHGIEVDGASDISVAGNNLMSVRDVAVRVVDSSRVTVRNNFIDGAATAVRGIRTQGLVVEFNGAINIRGYYPDGQLVQLDSVSGGGNRVRCNAADLSVGAPDPAHATATQAVRTEDIINTWMTRGAPDDPVLIAFNRLRGGSSFTGSGILAGDGGGAYITVVGNRVVNPWNCGIGVAGGQHMRVERNRIYSDLPGSIAGEGMYIRDFYDSACGDILHQNNEIVWPATDWSTEGWTQTFWQPAGECVEVTGTASNDLAASLTPAIFTEPIPECRSLAESLGLSPAGW